MKKMTWLNTCSAVAAVAAVSLYALVGCSTSERSSNQRNVSPVAHPAPTGLSPEGGLQYSLSLPNIALGADRSLHSLNDVAPAGEVPVPGVYGLSEPAAAGVDAGPQGLSSSASGRGTSGATGAEGPKGPGGAQEAERKAPGKPATVGARPVGAARGGGGGGAGAAPADPKAGAKADADGEWKDRRVKEAAAFRKSLEVRPEPRFDEELWVISKAAPTLDVLAEKDGAELRAVGDRVSDDRPGSGSLVCVVPSAGRAPKQVPIPLKHTDVKASVSGFISQVSVTQQFVNPYSEKIEAVYVFPLPEDAAVNDFLMKVGDRTIRGIIRERGEAERIYAAAREQGYAASLLTQERPNIFTQKVANIEPGKSIDISITYFNTLAYRDGAFEFVFPMVVGPRFNPPVSEGERAIGMGGEGVGAVPRGAVHSSGQTTEVQYLRPGERSGADIAVELTIDAGMKIESVRSATHAVNVARESLTRARVTLGRSDRIPNRDLVVRIGVAGSDVRTGIVRQETKDGEYFAMMVVPPARLEQVRRGAIEWVFVVDCSGSMDGYPLTKAKECVARGLSKLRDGDSFQIIRFAAEAGLFAKAPVAATTQNIRRGTAWVNGLNSMGGTYMIEGVRAALTYPHAAGRERVVCFLTDGYIGNERDILREIRTLLGPSHIFSFGVGTSVNRYLMDSMARIGRGAVAYVGPQDNVADAMDPFFDRVTHAAMTNVRIDFEGCEVADVYPRRLPDLYVGRPIMVMGRLPRGAETGQVRVLGSILGDRGVRDAELSAAWPERARRDSAIGALWARGRIAYLSEEMLGGDAAELRGAVLNTALVHNLVSQYTAFVAVDSMTRTQGDHGTTVVVPVPMPEGVRYETTVGKR